MDGSFQRQTGEIPLIESNVTPAQKAAIEKQKEFAERLGANGDLSNVGEEVLLYYTGGVGSVSDIIDALGIGSYAPKASKESLKNGVSLFLRQSLDEEKHAELKANNTRRVGLINAKKANEANRKAGFPQSKDPVANKRRIEKLQDWKLTHPEEVRSHLRDASKINKERLVESGGFDYDDAELIEYFLNLCKTVVHESGRLEGKPDFNKIAKQMNEDLGFRKRRVYYVHVYFELRRKRLPQNID